jgi:hypothetical protein
MFGYGKKNSYCIVEDKKEERLTIVAIVGDEKKEEQLLMGLTKRK